jgi:hypothetical protein
VVGAERAEAHYRQALTLAEPRGMRPLTAHCHLGLGRLYRRIDDHSKATEYLSTAVDMFRAMGMVFWLAEERSGPLDIAQVPLIRRSERISLTFRWLLPPP